MQAAFPEPAQLAARMAEGRHTSNCGPIHECKAGAGADQDATKKAYCRKKPRETDPKKVEKATEVDKLTSKVNEDLLRCREE